MNRHILYRLDIFLHSFIVTDVEVSAFSECFLFAHIFTPTRNREGAIFSLQFVCVCQSVREINPSQIDAPIKSKRLWGIVVKRTGSIPIEIRGLSLTHTLSTLRLVKFDLVTIEINSWFRFSLFIFIHKETSSIKFSIKTTAREKALGTLLV